MLAEIGLTFTDDFGRSRFAEGERDACLVSGRRFLLTLTRLICFTLNSADWPVDSSLLFPDLDLVRDRDRAVSIHICACGVTGLERRSRSHIPRSDASGPWIN